MTVMNKEELQTLQQILETLQDDLENLLDISKDSGNTVTLDQSKVGRLSRMDALQQQAMAQANRVGHSNRLVQVKQALNLMADGDYGYCESCGEVIPVERLLIKPESIYCIDCQSKLEKQS